MEAVARAATVWALELNKHAPNEAFTANDMVLAERRLLDALADLKESK